jgi:DNA invertase Pin-like site-specific DNA recombinase
MLKAFAYLRVSGQSQTEGDGFPRQRAAISAYAKANGYRIEKWFEELAVAGKTEWDQRPAWTEMVFALGTVNVIFVEKLDRLARDLMVQEHIIADLRKRHVSLISCAEPDLCVDDPTRKLLRQIMGAIAEYDRAMITAKLAGARKRMKAATGKCEGRKPYGFRPGESEVIRAMKKGRDAGYSFDAIAEHLNKNGFPSRRGGAWIGATVQKILKRVQ